MSIFPSTDIVLDVARAADPRRLHVAMKRLDDAGSLTAPRARMIARTPDANATAFYAALSNGLTARPAPTARPTPPTSGTEASVAQKFEAFILQSWLELLLPKANEASFGLGEAGSVWRSMMAEQLGAQIARAGGVGIQKILDLGGAKPDPTHTA